MNTNTRKTLQHGDKVTALGLSFSIDRILYQDFFGSVPPAPGSDFWGFDCEFIDTKGNYHHWKQNEDNGTAYRWNGRQWEVI